MLPITYYFWNSYKKSGYVRWKLDRAEYDKQVTQQWKDSNVFVKKLVENVLEDQGKTVKETITTLEIEVNNADKELKRIQALKSDETDKTSEIFANREQILKQEEYRIQQEFPNNSLLEVQQLKKAKEVLWDLLEFLGTYGEEVKKWVAGQSERLLWQRKNALKHNTRLTAQEIKENITPKENKEKDKKDNKNRSQWNIMWKSLWYLIILWVICIFDIFLWYVWIVWVLRRSITSERAVVALWWFLATILIPLAISLVHFAVVAKEKWWSMKQLWNITIITVIFLLVLYACQSVWKDEWLVLQNFTFWNLINVLQNNPEFLLRCFIIPSLFVWEIIIDLINWDSILEYFWIWKKRWTNSLSRLITNGLYLLKSKKISNYAREERRAIEKLINEMQKEELPVFAEIKKDVAEIQSILDPIWNKQSKKNEEYDEKIARIKNKIEKNLSDRTISLQWITNKYAWEIARLENIKRINEIKINKLNHDFNQASIDVKEWILIWLIDK